jgi:hypothetical protein
VIRAIGEHSPILGTFGMRVPFRIIITTTATIIALRSSVAAAQPPADTVTRRLQRSLDSLATTLTGSHRRVGRT